MEKISSHTELKETIRLLEIKQVNDGALLREQFKSTVESFKPSRLIKETISDLTTIPDLKGDLLNTTISLAAGFLSKKIAVGTTHNPLKQLLGTLLQMGVTSIVSKNADGIKSVAIQVVNRIFNKKETIE